MSAQWNFNPMDTEMECPVLRRTRQIRLGPGEELDLKLFNQHSYKIRTASTLGVPKSMEYDLPSNAHPSGGKEIYGWLEMPASIKSAGDGVYQVFEEWHYKLLPVSVYGKAV